MSIDPVQFEDDAIEEIAVIGLAGRFPGARNVEEFWQMTSSVTGEHNIRF